MFDLIEILTPIGIEIFTTEQSKEAEEVLKGLVADIRLDFHGVLDTLPVTPLPIDKKVPICCICFVGRQSQTRIDARGQILERIESGQIEFGILVFKRGTIKVGTKAWVNFHLLHKGERIFIDDSEDNILTTREICPSIQCIHHISEKPEDILSALLSFTK